MDKQTLKAVGSITVLVLVIVLVIFGVTFMYFWNPWREELGQRFQVPAVLPAPRQYPRYP